MLLRCRLQNTVSLSVISQKGLCAAAQILKCALMPGFHQQDEILGCDIFVLSPCQFGMQPKLSRKSSILLAGMQLSHALASDKGYVAQKASSTISICDLEGHHQVLACSITTIGGVQSHLRSIRWCWDHLDGPVVRAGPEPACTT